MVPGGMDREVGVSSKPSKQKLGAATKAAKAAARKATIAKGVATKKADKGVSIYRLELPITRYIPSRTYYYY